MGLIGAFGGGAAFLFAMSVALAGWKTQERLKVGLPPESDGITNGGAVIATVLVMAISAVVFAVLTRRGLIEARGYHTVYDREFGARNQRPGNALPRPAGASITNAAAGSGEVSGWRAVAERFGFLDGAKFVAFLVDRHGYGVKKVLANARIVETSEGYYPFELMTGSVLCHYTAQLIDNVNDKNAPALRIRVSHRAIPGGLLHLAR